MAEYIEREKAVNAVRNVYLGVQAINRIKAEDVEPVRHGRWVQCFEDWRKQIDGDKCSVCGFEHYGSVISHYHYCPNCGAKMNLEGDSNA